MWPKKLLNTTDDVTGLWLLSRFLEASIEDVSIYLFFLFLPEATEEGRAMDGHRVLINLVKAS